MPHSCHLSLRAAQDPSTVIERIHRELSMAERRKSSTLRELLGYTNAVCVIGFRLGDRLRGRLVEIVGDSQAAGAIFHKGGTQRVDLEAGELELFEASLDVIHAAAAGGFDVIFRWAAGRRRRALQVR